MMKKQFNFEQAIITLQALEDVKNVVLINLIGKWDVEYDLDDSDIEALYGFVRWES